MKLFKPDYIRSSTIERGADQKEIIGGDKIKYLLSV
jgi:hypothetical protein